MTQGMRDGLLFVGLLITIGALTAGLVWADRVNRAERHDCFVAWLGRGLDENQALKVCE